MLHLRASPYLTQKRQEHRMCMVFDERLNNKFAMAIKRAGGMYRRIGSGRKGWLVHPDYWDMMLDLMLEYDLVDCADEIRRCIDNSGLIKEVHRVGG